MGPASSAAVKSRKAQGEQMFSALPSTTDVKAAIFVSLVPIGRLIAFDNRSGSFVLKKGGIFACE
jgi:hypothetical protein